MAKTETQIDLKINKGTYAKIQENLSQIGEDELIITDDKNIPVPVNQDEGKVLYVNNGDYALDKLSNVLGIEVNVAQLGEGTTTISLTQEQENTLLLHSKEPTQIIVRIGTDRYYFYKEIETETVERYTCITPTTSALYSYMLQYTKNSGELVLYDSVEVQIKNLITDIETHKTENGSYPSTKAVYDYCQTLGIPVLETTQDSWNSSFYLTQDQLTFVNQNAYKTMLIHNHRSADDEWYLKNAESSYSAFFQYNDYGNNRVIRCSINKSNGYVTFETRSIENGANKKTSVSSYSSSNTYYPTTKAVYDFVKGETKYIIVSDYSALSTTNVSEGTLAYCQTIDNHSHEAGFYQYKNNTWNYVELENIEPINVTITGNFDVSQTYTFTIDSDDMLPLLKGATLVIGFTGGGSSIFRPDFFQTGQTTYTSSAVVVLNNTQYIATIDFDLSVQNNNATLSFSEIEGGGGSQASEQFTKIKLHTQSTVTIPDPNEVEPDRTETLTQYWTAIIPKSNEAIIIANANALLQESFTTLDELFTYLNTAITSSGSTDSTMIGMYDMMIRLIMGLTTFKFEVNFDYVDTYDTPVENTTQYGLDTEIDNATIKVYIGFQNLSNLGNYIEITPDKIFQIEYSNYSFGSGSSTGGGSGKLYEWDLALERYDENGDVVRYSYNTSPTDNNLYLSLLIYESNFERFKASAQQYGLSINQPSDLTAFINNSFDESIGSTSQTTLGILLTLVTQADKVLLLMGNMQSEVTADTTGLLISLNTWQPLQFFNDSSGTNIFYGLNCNNSCTLTEYGTSGGSSSSQPSIPERFSLAYNLVVNINQEQFANGSWTGDNTSNIRTFQYNGSNSDQAKATELVEFLTGVPVLDEYNATKPTPCFVFCTQSNICWKLQWESNGLKAYKVNNFPFVVKENNYCWNISNINDNELRFWLSETAMQDLYSAINQVMPNIDPTWQDITDYGGVISFFNTLKQNASDPTTFGLILAMLGCGGYVFGDRNIYSQKTPIYFTKFSSNGIETVEVTGVKALTNGGVLTILYKDPFGVLSNGLITNDSSEASDGIYIDSNATLQITKQ